MINIFSRIDDFRRKEWPTLVVNHFSRTEIAVLSAQYFLSFYYCWHIFISGPHAESFLTIFFPPIVLLLTKNRMFFISTLIAFQLVISFWCIGNPQDIVSYTGALFFVLFALSSYKKCYYLAIISTFLFFVPGVQGYSPIHVLGIVLVIMALQNRSDIESNIFSVNPFFKRLFVIFAIWITLATIWSPTLTSIPYSYYRTIIIFMLYGLTLVYLNDENKIYKAFYTWAIAGIFYAGARTISQPTAGESDILFFTSKNTVSSLINFSAFAIFPLLTMKTRKVPHFLWLTALVMILAINYFIGSKGGFAAFVVGLILYWILLDKRKSSRIKVLLLKISTASIVIFVTAQVFLVPLLYMNLRATVLPFTLPPEAATLFFRFEQWDYGKQMLDDGNYLIGLGLNGYGYLYGSFYESDALPKPWQNHPHSIYVHVFCDFGIIGMLIFITILVSFFIIMAKFILRSNHMPFRILALSVYVSVFSFLIHALVDWSLVDERLWLFIGLGMAIITVERKSKSKNVPFPESRSSSPFTF